MSESSIEVNGGQLQDFTIDQFAGASALLLGSIGGLLMVIWKSRCACRVRLGLSDKCYLFDCERKPPDLEQDSDDEPIIPPPKKTKPETKPEEDKPKEAQTIVRSPSGTTPQVETEDEIDNLL
tara:strand:+ start:9017 stop:9385 length:369 start_codon:yes stop_codon:yes gene_type:complete